jgi:hypothetical protein
MNKRRFMALGRLFTSLLLLATLTAAGCGSRTGIVTGVVRFRHRALTTGTVSYYCENGEIVSSLISPEGTYRLPQVAPGSVRVAVVSHPAVPPGLQVNQAPAAFAPPVSRTIATPAKLYTPIPAKYNRPDHAGLTFVIRPGEQTVDIELTP